MTRQARMGTYESKKLIIHRSGEKSHCEDQVVPVFLVLKVQISVTWILEISDQLYGVGVDLVLFAFVNMIKYLEGSFLRDILKEK